MIALLTRTKLELNCFLPIEAPRLKMIGPFQFYLKLSALTTATKKKILAWATLQLEPENYVIELKRCWNNKSGSSSEKPRAP